MIIANVNLNYSSNQQCCTKLNFMGKKSKDNPSRKLPSDSFVTKTQTKTGAELILPDYDTIKGYNSCSENAKNILRNRFIAECKLKYPDYPFLEENNIDKLINLSKFFIDRSERHNYRLAGIGRSPLWILETGKLLKDGIDDYINAAFSGAFYPEGSMPDKTIIDHYRNYLKKIELDPETIVNKSRENGQKTIFIDLVGTGDCMNSFMQIFSNWTKEITEKQEGFFKDFKESMAIYALQHQKAESYWHKEFKSGHIRINPNIYEGLITQDEKLNNKLGVHYSCPEWLRIDPLKAKPSENARLMRFWIIDHLAKNNMLRSL